MTRLAYSKLNRQNLQLLTFLLLEGLYGARVMHHSAVWLLIIIPPPPVNTIPYFEKQGYRIGKLWWDCVGVLAAIIHAQYTIVITAAISKAMRKPQQHLYGVPSPPHAPHPWLLSW